MMSTSGPIEHYSRMKSKRRPLTLLEILVVILILSMVGGLFTLGIQKLVQQQRFNNEVNMVLDRIRLAQDLMLLYDADVQIIFKTPKDKEDQIEYLLRTEQNISGNWNWLVSRKATPLKTVTEISLDRSSQPSLSQQPLELKFYSKGTVMTKGNLKFSDGENERYIYLSGYPKPIELLRSSSKRVDSADKERQAEEAMTQDTMRLVQQAQQISEGAK